MIADARPLDASSGRAPVFLAADSRQASIRRLVASHDGGIDAAVGEVDAALVRLADGLGAEFQRWLAEGGSDARGRILSMELEDALDLIDEVLGPDGTSLMDDARAQWFRRLHDLAESGRRITGSTGAAIERLDVEAWAQIQKGALTNAASAWDTNVKRVLGDSLLVSANEALYATPAVVNQRIGAMVRDLTPGVLAESLTSTAIYDRSIAAGIIADVDPDGELRWCYSGPIDGIQRPFCTACSRRSFTPAQVGDLDNGQGMPVAEGCGGYRCRHRWLFMETGQALKNGYRAAGAADVVYANAVARSRRRR